MRPKFLLTITPSYNIHYKNLPYQLPFIENARSEIESANRFERQSRDFPQQRKGGINLAGKSRARSYQEKKAS